MTSVFSWPNAVSLCPASFCTPRPNLPVTPGIPWFPTITFQSPWWKGHHFFMLVLEVLECLHRNVQLQFVWHQWLGHRLGLLWCWMFCLGNKPRSFCHFWDCTAFWALADYAGYSISSKGFLPTTLYIMVIWVKFTHPTVHFSSLIPQMLKFTLAILFDHFQFTLICGPNIPGLYAILFFKYRT